MMQTTIDIASWFLLTLGGLFVLVGGIGALRMPTLYSRMHAASLTDTIAAVSILFGIMLQSGWTLATVKLIAVLLFLLFTSPTSSNALASAAILAGHNPDEDQVQPPEPFK